MQKIFSKLLLNLLFILLFLNPVYSNFKGNISSFNFEKDIKSEDTIKWIKWLNINYYYFLFFQIFLLCWVFIYFKFLKINSKEFNLVEKKEIIQPNFLNSLSDNLEYLISCSDVLEKSEFYEKLNFYFREYFNFLGFHDTEFLTLKEIKRIWIPKEIITLFEKSYINEFSEKKDTLRTRKSLVSKFLTIIK